MDDKDAQDAPVTTPGEADSAKEKNAPGLVVRYTTRLGEVRRATIEESGADPEGTVRATLNAEVDGRWQRFVGVPYNADGEINTWDYAAGEAQ